MPLLIAPHTLQVYRPEDTASGPFVGKPTYALAAITKGLLEPKAAGELFRVWGVEVTHGAEALMPAGMNIEPDYRLLHGNTYYRVVGVMSHDGTSQASHIKCLLERLDNV